MAIKTGDQCPSFKLMDQHGEWQSSTKLIGDKVLVIYFYPKDNTPGCTQQACSFRDAYQDFMDAGADVIGISSDSNEKHLKFARQHNLPFTLLADGEKQARKAFGVPTNLFGIIPGRVTYIIDKSGTVRDVFNSQTDIQGHVNQALKVIKSLH